MTGVGIELPQTLIWTAKKRTFITQTVGEDKLAQLFPFQISDLQRAATYICFQTKSNYKIILLINE